MTPSLTRPRLYLFPLTSEPQLTLAEVVRVLSIGNEFVQPAIQSIAKKTKRQLMIQNNLSIIHRM